MALDPYQMGYFITQVGLAAASFGVATEDVTAVGMALNQLFGYRCAPETPVVPSQGPQLQSMCIVEACPISPNATCDAYDREVIQPMNATEGDMASSSSGSMPSSTASGTAGEASATPTSGASIMSVGSFVAVVGTLFAFAM